MHCIIFFINFSWSFTFWHMVYYYSSSRFHKIFEKQIFINDCSCYIKLFTTENSQNFCQKRSAYVFMKLSNPNCFKSKKGKMFYLIVVSQIKRYNLKQNASPLNWLPTNHWKNYREPVYKGRSRVQRDKSIIEFYRSSCLNLFYYIVNLNFIFLHCPWARNYIWNLRLILI